MFIKRGGLPIALNNQMKRTQTKLQKTIEKLATGQSINAAADDASGLAISQKLRALQMGNHQAIRNVQDAHSLVQVADGAMQEMTGILHRIRELTVQAMNGTNTDLNSSSNSAGALSGADTIILQNEIDDLKKSLNNIVQNTEFNQKKLLTNKTPGEYIYEDRSAAKTIQLSNTIQTEWITKNVNLTDYESEYAASVVHAPSYTYPVSSVTATVNPEIEARSTVIDYRPRWSSDGSSIIFESSRNNQQYIVPADGSLNPTVNNGGSSLPAKVVTDNGNFRLRNVGSYLYLEKKDAGYYNSWSAIQSFSYSTADGSAGYSFAPTADAGGNTAFIYSDAQGNIKKVNLNINTGAVSSPADVISTTDTLNLPPVSNVLTLNYAPDLYRMNGSSASLKVYKVNDNGSKELRYWDGTGNAPAGGYYTVSNNRIQFYDEAIIGKEPVDDAQDYYTFSYVKDSSPDNTYTQDIPAGAQIYNMHGEEGPRSLDIRVGSRTVTQVQLLSARPADPDGTTGVYVNEATNKLEFYGDLRPAHNETVTVEYMSDTDANRQVQTFKIPTSIDTYNLMNPDLSANRSLRVYVDGTEISYDQSKTNGFMYDPSTGNLSLYGNARSDVSGNPRVEIKYIADSSGTSGEIYGIRLGSSQPEVFNLGSSSSPNSIRIYRGTEEIAYSNQNGFQYNQSTNTIELYGSGRPNIGDTYTVRMVLPTDDYAKTDDKIEVKLSSYPETYGVQTPDIPSTFRVQVNGQDIQYDETKQNGFYYNSSTNRIEIYGDARPDAGNLYNPDIQVSYVIENSVALVGNNTYDFQLASTTLDYGLTDSEGPKAIRVYHGGAEIPYNSEEGYTYDPVSQRLSLHGSYRPVGSDIQGEYEVYSINPNDLQKTVPSGVYIYRVEMNGQEIQKANSSDGSGYIYNGHIIEIVGDARPDVTRTTSSIQLNVSYFDSLEVSLNDSAPGGFFNHYCEHEVGEGILKSEVDPEHLRIELDGTLLTSDQYRLSGDKIVLNQDKLTLDLGNHQLKVDYRVRHALGYEPNDFTFQVGANAGNTKRVEIASFDNMLKDTNVICVRTFEDAKKGLAVIDKAMNFVLGELGNIGAVENSLDSIASNLSTMEQAAIEARSRIQDSDIAKETLNLTRLQILSEAQKAMSSHIKQSQEQVLQLLKQ
ncbi:flagellin [Pseudobacillus sp. 179-B 2D1 NHS]|uniref:flagellin N-terminal helical domain-containing protein n=1 Tax=Pseudobacillus sp. 179-B 2D1 NHS TaxID=3374292 RepID=UPI003879FE70